MRKKLFAILMSAMMMVTFMPSMAFATPQIIVTPTATAETTEVFYVDGWASDFSTVDGHYYASTEVASRVDTTIPAVRTLQATGTTLAEPDLAYLPTVCVSSDAGKAAKNVLFYDWNGFTMDYGVAMTYSDFETKFIDTYGDVKKNATDANLKFKVVRQSYDAYYGVASRDQFYTNVTLDDTNITLNVKGYDVTTPYTEQTVTITATPTPETATNAKTYFGDIAPATVKVLRKTPSVSDVKFYYDEVSSANQVASGNAVKYTGAAHKIVASEVPGFTVSYKQLNSVTNRYETVETPTFTNAGTYTNAVEYSIKNAAGTEVDSNYLTAVVNKADIKIDFLPPEGLVYVDEVTDPWTYITITAVDKYSKAALAADAAVLDEMMKTIAKASVSDRPYVANEKVLNVEYAFTTAKEYAAFKVKYATQLGNYNINIFGHNDQGRYFELNGASTTLTKAGNTKHNEIEFVQVPAVKKYHNKKGVLKKNYTFTVKAEALSGVAPSYKLINANSKIVIDKTTGKITVKKGLKKGTYTVKVKAYGAAGNGYAAAEEYQTLKIVLTK